MPTPILYQSRWAPQPPTHPLAAGDSLHSDIFRCLSPSTIDQNIIATQLTASISMLAQGAADVAWPNDLASAVGVSVQLVAASGSGKTVASRTLVEPISLHMREIARVATNGRPPLDIFIEDVTREATIEHLRVCPVAVLHSDEAGQLKPLLKTAAPTFAKLIDGAPLRNARISTGRVELTNYRFMMSLMEQPDVFRDTKMLLGANNGGVGLMNRFNFGVAQASPVGASVFNLKLSADIQTRYEQRICKLLEATVKLVHDRQPRPKLVLTEEAQGSLIRAGTQMRVAAQQDARFAAASEYVARHSERVLRFAGALHVFEHGPTGEVDIDCVETSRQVDLLSIEAYLQLTHEPPQRSQADLDAERIQHELTQMTYVGQYAFPVSYLRRLSPNLGITKGRFDRALALLGDRRFVTLFIHERQDWLRVTPPQLRF